MGLSWIFCVKRVFVFCLRDLHHLAKALRTLQKIRSNPDQATLGRVLIPTSHIKNAPIKGAYFYYGAPNGLLIDPIILQLKNAVSTVECEYCLYNLSKIAA